ncbi:hypothetical protein Glove_58g15 [Diversispora epigaea]|uniref:Uncharacterized protein n=1 Tax=Diversispora epigaea TaxID=1348612 RepID=A0A397JC58_9GLOM|nr:hypothetical protein Glove_58g17 [Diversispora epigaea]RHZ85939.1 hypothetical protein Glove_58g15 [Diversispora epigaea]
MPPLSKRKKQIKKLAELKQKKNNVLMEESESNNDSNDDSNNESNDESNDEITWNDYELDERANNYIEILLDGIKNYVPSARKMDKQLINFLLLN